MPWLPPNPFRSTSRLAQPAMPTIPETPATPAVPVDAGPSHLPGSRPPSRTDGTPRRPPPSRKEELRTAMMKLAAKTLGPFVEPSVPQTPGRNPPVGEPVDVPMVMLGAAQDPAPPALPEPAPFFRFSARPRPAHPESPSLSPSTSVLGSDGDGGGEMVALGADHRAFAPGSTDREAGMGTRTGSPVPSVLDPARGSDSDDSHRPRRPGLHRGSTQNSLGDSGPLPTAQDLINARQALSDAEARSGANSFDTLLAQSLVKDIERRLAAASGGALAPSEVSSRAASNRGLWGGDSSLSLPGDDSATASLHGSS